MRGRAVEGTERCVAGEHDVHVEARNLNMHGKLKITYLVFTHKKGSGSDIKMTKTKQKKKTLQGQAENALQHVNFFFCLEANLTRK